jgi:predicted DNA-binding ribbon-helix-helix protein
MAKKEDLTGTRMVTFMLDSKDYEKVVLVSRVEDRSLSAVLRLAVRDYLSKSSA